MNQKIFNCSLIYLKTNNQDKFLFGLKLKNFMKGLMVAPGGKLNENENMLDCAKREVFEETGIIIEKNELNFIGKIEYAINNKILETKPIFHVCIYYVQRPNIQDFGQIRQSLELNSDWYNFDQLKQFYNDGKINFDVMEYLDKIFFQNFVHFFGKIYYKFDEKNPEKFGNEFEKFELNFV